MDVFASHGSSPVLNYQIRLFGTVTDVVITERIEESINRFHSAIGTKLVDSAKHLMCWVQKAFPHSDLLMS